MRVTVVVPAFNEARYIGTLLERIAAVEVQSIGCSLEIIVVDDGSTDGTAALVASTPGVTLIRKRNGGKGSAVRAGIAAASGDYVLVQDADLEYDPRDYVPMLRDVVHGRATVVYGSRYLQHASRGKFRNLLAERHPQQSLTAYLGGRSLSVVAWALTGTYLTDTVTALKLLPRALLIDLGLVTSGFELDHEITSKVLARRIPITEVPIRYYPRSRQEGKKIGWRDWITASRTFWRFRRG